MNLVVYYDISTCESIVNRLLGYGIRNSIKDDLKGVL